MTEWLPVLTPGRHGGARRQTKHRVLTEAIIADIDAGRLTRGQQLPAHRELALRLGLSARTVSASYKEVERRGYLRSEAGRGTFVKGRIAEGGGCRLDMRPSGSFDLSVVRAVFTERHDAASRTLLAAALPDLGRREVFCCGPRGFMTEARLIHAAEGGDKAQFHTESGWRPAWRQIASS